MEKGRGETRPLNRHDLYHGDVEVVFSKICLCIQNIADEFIREALVLAIGEDLFDFGFIHVTGCIGRNQVIGALDVDGCEAVGLATMVLPLGHPVEAKLSASFMANFAEFLLVVRTKRRIIETAEPGNGVFYAMRVTLLRYPSAGFLRVLNLEG